MHCNVRFKQRADLKAHLATHTSDVTDAGVPAPRSEVRPFRCATCQKFFRRNCDLRRHILAHVTSAGCTGSDGGRSEVDAGDGVVEAGAVTDASDDVTIDVEME